MKLRSKLAGGLSVIIVLSCCACGEVEVEVSHLTELPFSYSTAVDDVSVAKDTLVMDYLYAVHIGDLDTAYALVDIPESVVFDMSVFKTCINGEGYSKADSVMFYSVQNGSTVVDEDGKSVFVPSDTTVSVSYKIIQEGTESDILTKELKVKQMPSGEFRLDVEGQYYTQGTLKFAVPSDVRVYLNEALVSPDLQDKNNVYTVSGGATSGDDMTLRLETDFGYSESYPVHFLGTSSDTDDTEAEEYGVDPSLYVNPSYADEELGYSVFTMSLDKEFLNKAKTYLQTNVFEPLFSGLVKLDTFDMSAIQKEFTEKSNKSAMKPFYFNSRAAFESAGLQDNGGFSAYDMLIYDLNLSDEVARDNGVHQGYTGLRSATLFVTFSYNYKYTLNGGKEQMYSGTCGTKVVLTCDDNGNLKVENIAEDGFCIGKEY